MTTRKSFLATLALASTLALAGTAAGRADPALQTQPAAGQHGGHGRGQRQQQRRGDEHAVHR